MTTPQPPYAVSISPHFVYFWSLMRADVCDRLIREISHAVPSDEPRTFATDSLVARAEFDGQQWHIVGFGSP